MTVFFFFPLKNVKFYIFYTATCDVEFEYLH